MPNPAGCGIDGSHSVIHYLVRRCRAGTTAPAIASAAHANPRAQQMFYMIGAMYEVMNAKNLPAKRSVAVIMIVLVAACFAFGCLGGDSDSNGSGDGASSGGSKKPSKPWVPPEKPYVKSIDTSKLKLGTVSEATITICNNGSEAIAKENIAMTATLLKLDDWKVNPFLKKMSAEEKTETYELEFTEQIKNRESCALCAEFDLPAKVETKFGKISIAGTYHVVIQVYADDTLIGTRTMDLHLTT